MTKAEAEIWCKDYMNQSPGYVACEQVPNVDHERAIEICVLDIMVKNCTVEFYRCYFIRKTRKTVYDVVNVMFSDVKNSTQILQ